MTPPRPRTRAAPEPPRQPYPPADDFVEPPVDTEDEESIPLHSPDVPTMRELGDAIGNLGTQLVQTERRLSDRIGGVERRVDARLGNVHEEMALLRQTVLGDHAGRITGAEQAVKEVEATARKLTLSPAVKTGSIGMGAGGIVVFAAEVLWPFLRQWLESR